MMVEEFLQRLCQLDTPGETMKIFPSNTEPPFSMDELELVLAHKKDSAPGTDGIKYSTILQFPIHVKEKFLELVNDLWSSQDIPNAMKNILMVHVLIPHPGRDLNLLGSHHPIALLSVYLKVINSMIKTRLEQFIDGNRILDGRSYGFVRHRSAINCVNHLLSVIKEKQLADFVVMGIFIDLEDAFSNVNLNQLQSVLNRLGIPEQYINWFVIVTGNES